MDPLYRLIRLFACLAFGLLLGGWATWAGAQSYPACPSGSICNTPEGGCVAGSGGGTFNLRIRGPLSSLGNGWVYSNNCGGFGVHVKTFSSCAAGEIWDSVNYVCKPPCQPAGLGEAIGECGCAEGLSAVGFTCQKDCTAENGKTRGSAGDTALLAVDNPKSYNSNSAFCVEGCAAEALGGVKCHWNNDASGDVLSLGAYCGGSGPFRFNGRSCASYGAGGISDIATVDTPDPTPWWQSGQSQSGCTASGGAWGQVNGVDVCVGGAVGGTGGSGTGAGNGSGGGVGAGGAGSSESKPPTQSEVTNPDGSKTITSTSTNTQCDRGICQTTTATTVTTTAADGSSDGGKSTTTVVNQPKVDFCKSNPTASACVGTETKDSAWTGSCSAGYVCSGDAVQCAIARAAYEGSCRNAWVSQENEMAEVGRQAVAGVSPVSEADAARALNKDGQFDFDVVQAYTDAQREYVQFTGECMPIPPIELFGKTIVLEIGVICDYGVFVRVFMRILAYLAVIRMFVRKF